MSKITLKIKKENLLKIISGEKTEEYREAKNFYFKKFGEMNDESYFIKPPEKIIFEAGYSKDFLFAEVEVEKIRYEQFFKKIPENFKQGDVAITIYIKKVVNSNLIL